MFLQLNLQWRYIAVLLGAISAAVELRSRDRRISSVFLAFEAGTFILFTNRRTLVDAQQRQQESDVSSVAGRRAYETISFAAGQTFATVIFLNLKHYLCFQLRS